MAPNPYVTGTEVLDRRLFFGRQDDLKQLFGCLDSKTLQSAIIVGPRKSGKTSLLYRMSDVEMQKAWLQNLDSYLFVFGDFDSAHLLTPSDLYAYLIDRVLSTLKQPNPLVGTLDAATFVQQVKAALGERRLVFLLDGIEMAVSRGALRSETIHALGDLSGPNICYIFTATDTLDRLVAWAAQLGFVIDASGAAALRRLFTTVVYPSLLSDDEARALIQQPAQRAGAQISDEATDFVIDLVGAQPFFLQLAAKYLYEGLTDLGGFGAENASIYRKRIEQACQGYLSMIWQVLDEDEQQVLTVLITGGALPPELFKTVQRLLDKRLITQSENDPKLRPISQLLGEFVVRISRGEQAPAPTQQTKENLERCLLSITCDSYGKSVSTSLHGMASYVAECEELLLPGLMNFSLRARESMSSPELLKITGKDLFEAMFKRHDAIDQAYAMARTLVSDRRLGLRLRGPRDFVGIPFELLHDSDGQALALRHPISRMVTRQLCHRRSIGPEFFDQVRSSGQRPRALLIAANVAGEVLIGSDRYFLPPLPSVDEEVRKVGSRLEERGWEVLTIGSTEAKLDFVQQHIESMGVHLLHFAGHGIYVVHAPERSCLIVSDDEGKPLALGAEWLHQALRESDLRFAFLSCCLGAASGSETQLTANDFLGVIDAVVTAGVPAALGYRWPISDEGARAVAMTFYDKIHQLDTLDEALLIARQEIRQQFDDDTWAAPILVLQG